MYVTIKFMIETDTIKINYENSIIINDNIYWCVNITLALSK